MTKVAEPAWFVSVSEFSEISGLGEDEIYQMLHRHNPLPHIVIGHDRAQCRIDVISAYGWIRKTMKGKGVRL